MMSSALWNIEKGGIIFDFNLKGRTGNKINGNKGFDRESFSSFILLHIEPPQYI